MPFPFSHGFKNHPNPRRRAALAHRGATHIRRVHKRKAPVLKRIKRKGMQLTRLVPSVTKVVKLSWDYDLNAQSIAAGSNQTLTFYPQCCTPFNSAATPSANDLPWQGLLQYAQIYTFGTILGASITVNVANAGTTQYVKTLLMALNYQDYHGGAYPLGVTGNSPSSIGALTYEQLVANPNNKHRTLGTLANAKGQCTMKMYRTSKKMLGITSMKDVISTAFAIGTSAAHGSGWANNDSPTSTGWYYLLNTYNQDPTNAQVVDYNIRMTAYCMLTGANFLPQTKFT
nr:MAG: capsid protein [Cressdnaviricota sp.]